jgi:CHASE3 domain sensor protein
VILAMSSLRPLPSSWRRAGTQADAEVQQWLRVFVNIERATAHLVDVETGLRGNLLAGQPAFLEPFAMAAAGEAPLCF